MIENERLLLAQGLSDILGYGEVCSVESGNMTEDEQGFSGAEVQRCIALLASGEKIPIIFKMAQKKERMSMKILTDQGHSSAPAAFSLDLIADDPHWMALEDVGRVKSPPGGLDWLPRIADALAGIHANNMGKGADMPWLPHADGDYWRGFLTTRISVDHFEAQMESSADFNREFGAYLPLLRKKADEFADDMTALYDEKAYLTLTHGDLQTIDGAHIHYRDEKPYIIDFGWCYYAPFYIDLASFFGFGEAKLYYDSLVRKGVSLRYGDFEERLRAAYRYNGFIYLCPSVRQWANGPTERTGKRLLQMLRIILTGDFPERRINYSTPVFEKLLAAHAAGTLDREALFS